VTVVYFYLGCGAVFFGLPPLSTSNSFYFILSQAEWKAHPAGCGLTFANDNIYDTTSGCGATGRRDDLQATCCWPMFQMAMISRGVATFPFVRTGQRHPNGTNSFPW